MRCPGRRRRPRGAPAAARIRTVPPAGVERSAFSTRFESAWSTRSGSPTATASGSAIAWRPTPNERAAASWRSKAATATSPRSSRCATDREGAAPQSGEVEQVADEPLEPLRLALDHRARAGRLEHAVLQRLGMAPDRGERRLQLVADGEEERPLAFLGSRQLAREVVEGGCERRDLARSGHGKRLGIVSGGERPARLRHPGHRARDRAREEPARRPRPAQRRRAPRGRARGRTASSRPPARDAGRRSTIASPPLRSPHRESGFRARRRFRRPTRPRGAARHPTRAAAARPERGVTIARRCSSVGRNWPSSSCPLDAGSATRCAAISSTWRSRARRPACSSERRVRSAPATTVTTRETSTVAEIPRKRRERRLTARACTRRREPCG